jgi:hypothetical protein
MLTFKEFRAQISEASSRLSYHQQHKLATHPPKAKKIAIKPVHEKPQREDDCNHGRCTDQSCNCSCHLHEPDYDEYDESVQFNEEFGDIHPSVAPIHATIQNHGYKPKPKKLTGRSDATEERTEHVYVHPKSKNSVTVQHIISKKLSPNNPASHNVGVKFTRGSGAFGDSVTPAFDNKPESISNLNTKVDKMLRTRG